MSIDFACPSCSQRLAAAEHQKQQTIRCPNCRGLVVVPEASQADALADEPPVPEACVPAAGLLAPLPADRQAGGTCPERLGLLLGVGCLAVLAGYLVAVAALQLSMRADWSHPPSPHEVSQLQRQVLQELSELPSGALFASAIGAQVFAFSGLWLSLRGLFRQGGRRKSAIAGVVICGLFSLLWLWAWLAAFLHALGVRATAAG